MSTGTFRIASVLGTAFACPLGGPVGLRDHRGAARRLATDVTGSPRVVSEPGLIALPSRADGR